MERHISKEYLAKICDAARTLCEYCEADMCENCIVNHLVNDAYNECPEAECED